MFAKPLSALATAALLAGCGGAGEPAPTPARPAATPAGTPFPESDFAVLRTGTTYTTRNFRPALEITPDQGEWTAEVGDRPEHVALALDVTRGQGILALHRITKVYDPAEGGEIPGDQVAGPADFAEWLAAHPHLRAGTPAPVEALGMRGVAIDVEAKSSPPRLPGDCGKFEPPCVPLFHDGLDFVLYPGNSKGRFLVLDDAGHQLVVEQWVEPRARFRKVVRSLDAQLRRIRLAG